MWNGLNVLHHQNLLLIGLTEGKMELMLPFSQLQTGYRDTFAPVILTLTYQNLDILAMFLLHQECNF